ncbi:MAG: T9SS type A sorting domain-containing protein [Chitinophagales bacterium]|nr:T9SS type A sorting domain-containing protein [Chitinophagales bacterium]
MYLHFTPPQISAVESIAFTCPLVGGEATYRARGMYAGVKDTLYNDQELCAAAGIYYKKEPAKQKPNLSQQVMSFKLNPNPAADYTYLNCNQVANGEWQLQITDYSGRELLTKNVTFSNKRLRIDSDKLSSGTYLLRLTQNGSTAFIDKLNISK